VYRFHVFHFTFFIPTFMRYLSLFIAILTLLVLTVGCGDGKLATIKVTGTVTYEGEPLAGASIAFSPKIQGEGHPAYGITDANGNYTLQTQLGNVDGGTTAGEYTVIISKREQTTPTGATGTVIANTGPPPVPKSLIPERYEQAATSGLTATVSRESKVFNFNLVK